MQQLGLVNQGGIQVDVTEHAASSRPGKTDEGEIRQDVGHGSASSLRSFDFSDGIGMKDCTIFYIGEESRGVINLMMENSGSKVSLCSTLAHPSVFQCDCRI